MNACCIIMIIACLSDGASDLGPAKPPEVIDRVPDPRLFDCGLVALSDLLMLEGRSVRVEELEKLLPARDVEGYSMSELRSVARHYGVDLEGVLLPKEETAIDRPMIVFVKRGTHGHYLVVRPVGPTGRLMQVIDSSGVPEVVDKRLVFASLNWTGLALVPRRWSFFPSRRVALGLLSVVTAFTALRLVQRSRRSPSPRPEAGSDQDRPS